MVAWLGGRAVIPAQPIALSDETVRVAAIQGNVEQGRKWTEGEGQAIVADLVALTRQDAVIGPTEDGGYYLLGMKQPNDALFEGIAWSTGTVYEETLRKLEQETISYTTLPTLRDLDHPEDLDFHRSNGNLDLPAAS